MGARPFASRASPASAGSPARASAGASDLGQSSMRARVGREAAALLLFAVAIFVLLGLASFRGDPRDPSVDGSNWVGPVGASLAGFIAQGFGLVSWAAPLELVLLGLPLLRGKTELNLGARISADLVITIILAALCQVASPELHVFGNLAGGGNVGLLFGELMRGLFSEAGSYLVGITAIGLILIGRSEFSFIDLSRRLTLLLQGIAEVLRALTQRLAQWAGQRWRERRDEAGHQEAEQERERPSPRGRAASKVSLRSEPAPDALIAQLTSEEESSEWIPFENTGPLPRAISAALRGTPPEEPAALAEAKPPSPKKARTKGAIKAAERRAPSEDELPEEPVRPGEEPLTLDSAALEASVLEFAGVRTGLESSDLDAGDESAAREILQHAEEPALPEAPTFEPEEPLPAGELQSDDDELPQQGDASPTALSGRGRKARPEPRIVDTTAEQQVQRTKSPQRVRGGFQLPPTSVLEAPPEFVERDDDSAFQENARLLEKTLADFGVSARVTDIRPGPTVTTYELVPAAGTKVSKIIGLTDDLSLGLSRKIRITALTERGRIGFEIPNRKRPRVYMRDLIEHVGFTQLAAEEPLPMVLGRDPVGAPFYADLGTMTHAIVAGATGAGKSVGLNVMLASLLFCRTPDELRMLMIDPKVVELAPFDGIPHLLLPVVTDMKQAATALRWAVDEMERRFQMFADAGTKNIKTYNGWVDRVVAGDIPAPAADKVDAITGDGVLVSVPSAKEGADGANLPGKLPYIVIVIDEFADLMMQQGKEVEASVARLAQKARAAGMHVLLATQRPSVDVITGMIKANFPTRIAFRVSQKVDSRTILDEQGAEMLLGKGDMLVKMNGKSEVVRVQCPFISEEEINQLTDCLRRQGSPQYHEAILQHADDDDEEAEQEQSLDSRYDDAVRIVGDTQRCSTSWLQRKMGIGYNRAAKIVEMMEKRGVVGPANGSKDREVLISPQ